MWRASLSADLVSHPHLGSIVQASGGMAQLVARLHGMEKVRGSNPLTSTAEGPGIRKGSRPFLFPNCYLTAAQQPRARLLGRRQVVIRGSFLG